MDEVGKLANHTPTTLVPKSAVPSNQEKSNEVVDDHLTTQSCLPCLHGGNCVENLAASTAHFDEQKALAHNEIKNTEGSSERSPEAVKPLPSPPSRDDQWQRQPPCSPSPVNRFGIGSLEIDNPTTLRATTDDSSNYDDEHSLNSTLRKDQRERPGAGRSRRKRVKRCKCKIPDSLVTDSDDGDDSEGKRDTGPRTMAEEPEDAAENEDEYDSDLAQLLRTHRGDSSEEESGVDLSELERIKADIESAEEVEEEGNEGDGEVKKGRRKRKAEGKMSENDDNNRNDHESELERWNRIVNLVTQMKTLMIKYPKFTSRVGSKDVVSALHAMMDTLEGRAEGGHPTCEDLKMVEEQMENFKSVLLQGIDEDLNRWKAQRANNKRFAIKMLTVFFLILAVTSYYGTGGRSLLRY